MQKLSAGKFHFEPPSRFTSFDHLIGKCEQPVGDLEAERLRGREIDHQLELDRGLNWKLARLRARQDASNIRRRAPKLSGRSVP
jgi:hypothetical protein